ncbi:MAG: hypothetical protein SAJ12_05280, partial [Jaaginema sp. PMC 1079.18]|nr:hypothetical protein [Jaaginema sp. PMC 1079.18]
MGIILAKGVWLLGTIAIAVLGFYLRNPMVASIRSELWWVGLGLGLLGLAIALFGVRRFPNQFQGYLGVAIASLNA